MINKKIIGEFMICTLVISGVISGCGAEQTKTDSETATQKIDVIQQGETMSGDLLDINALQSVNADVSFYDNIGVVIETEPVTSVITGTEAVSEQEVQKESSIYEAPSQDSQVVGSVAKKEKLTVYGEADDNGFVKVDYKGRICYILSDALTKTTDTNSSTSNKNTTNTTYTGGSDDSNSSNYSGSSSSNNSGGSSSSGSSSDSSTDSGSGSSSSESSGDSSSGGSSSDSSGSSSSGGSSSESSGDSSSSGNTSSGSGDEGVTMN